MLELRSEKYEPELTAAPLKVPMLAFRSEVLPALVDTPATVTRLVANSEDKPPASTLRLPPTMSTLPVRLRVPVPATVRLPAILLVLGFSVHAPSLYTPPLKVPTLLINAIVPRLVNTPVSANTAFEV